MIKLFTHTDLDGIGCAVLATLSGMERLTVHLDIEYCNYDNVNEKINTFFEGNNWSMYDEIYITDISISDELAEKIDTKILNSDSTVWLLDHHATALRLNKYAEWCLVMTEDEFKRKMSGTRLFYNYLIASDRLPKSPAIQTFVDMVTAYDTWLWKEVKWGYVCKKLNDLMYLYGRDAFINWCVDQLLRYNIFPNFSETDNAILKLEQKKIDEYVTRKDKELSICMDGDRFIGIVFAESYHSELGNRLCELHPEIDYVAIIGTDGRVGYRTIMDDIDLGKDVAARYGGGGHPKAAGHTFDKDVLLDVMLNMWYGQKEKQNETTTEKESN